MKLKFSATVLLLFGVMMAYSQSIGGVITEEDGSAGAYSQVVVFYADSTTREVGIANDKGEYHIGLKSDGKILLKVYYFGVVVFSKEINVTGKTIENIVIKPNIQLDSLVINANYKLIDTKVDRTVYNVENSVVSNGLDLYEVLAMTPMVMVSDEGVSIVGKSDVAVMIDGKMTNLSGRGLTNYLRSIRADDIAKIEVITAPPANYQAEGNSGIVNIIFKKNQKFGWNGSASSTYLQTTYAGMANNITLNYRNKKIASSLRLRHYDRNQRAKENIDIIGNNSIIKEDQRKDQYKGLGLNYSLDYQANKRINLGLIYDIGKLNTNLDINNLTTYKTNEVTDSVLQTYAEHRLPSLTQTLNCYADFVLDTNGSFLSVVGNYFSNARNNVVDFESLSSLTALNNIVRNTSEINYDIWSAQADLYFPIKWMEIEAGTKYTVFKNQSDVAYLNSVDGAYIVDPTRSNLFEYHEQNIAGYLSLTKQLSNKWILKAGLRYEYTLIEGYSPTTGERNENLYGNLFPTAYAAYSPNDKHSFTLNYSKRINRPSFRRLNPFRWYSNPYTYFTGNPLLRPSFNHNVEFNYTIAGGYTIGIYGQKLINGSGRTVELINTTENVATFANYLTKHDVGINASLFLDITKWWESYISLNAGYSESTSSLDEILPQNGFSSYYSLNNTFSINRKRKIKGLINFWHELPSRADNNYSEGISALSGGVRFPFLKERFQANILVSDILKGLVLRGEMYFSNFTQQYNQYYDARRFSVSISYNFGNKKVRENDKFIPFEEQYRGN